MKITVTQDHVDRTAGAYEAAKACRQHSWRGLCTSCPIALAIQDTTGCRDAATDGDHYSLTGTSTNAWFDLPDDARQWVIVHDKWFDWLRYDNQDVYTTRPPAPQVPVTFDI